MMMEKRKIAFSPPDITDVEVNESIATGRVQKCLYQKIII